MYALFKDGMFILESLYPEILHKWALPNSTIRVIFNGKYVLPKGYQIREVKDVG